MVGEQEFFAAADATGGFTSFSRGRCEFVYLAVDGVSLPFTSTSLLCLFLLLVDQAG